MRHGDSPRTILQKTQSFWRLDDSTFSSPVERELQSETLRVWSRVRFGLGGLRWEQRIASLLASIIWSWTIILWFFWFRIESKIMTFFFFVEIIKVCFIYLLVKMKIERRRVSGSCFVLSTTIHVMDTVHCFFFIKNHKKSPNFAIISFRFKGNCNIFSLVLFFYLIWFD